ncbi:hypothetical protein X753_14525 [Mesorhizobium sp. LNJC399B00]|uniref:hypothetical protein n=1 Tax=unclassified Mesorhizobium TaxID=325217 RepID=UPI0003CE7B78|nr:MULTISPECIES: hypothetical protein [unclassified Mesorhizobium]ESY06864.1 hypothetical protein X753_14525 [Mesorhizobium sp. LNJC399B00]WJI68647.1 hypothetical protein NLY36_28355 [Mesorhizobium sp. C399B]
MNNAIPDLSTVVRLPPANVGTGESELDSARVEAREHLEFFDWVLSIKGEYLGYGAEGIISFCSRSSLEGRTYQDGLG